ncbi:conserved hypothetical protein [Carnobacterium maltaromaticum]|uniref:GNAT family N-acetyltransferase n=1 Tax=Carnobacterium maltaromaticum TaxID=2751 RepID=UPI00191BB4CA|nr:GNAT family N-acetyltransferase [Carnobacterium maltaromaticum]CAD5901751.1 conserved hypothetical protein [Carnobacterium maltaromaticum]
MQKEFRKMVYNDLPAIKKYKEEFIKSEENMDGTGGLSAAVNIEEWFCRSVENENENSLSDKLVPAIQYIYIDHSTNKIIGMLQLRLKLNQYLTTIGGHIGYSINPTERKKGYGKQMLEQALIEAKKQGLEKVLLTCDSDNQGSRKIIESNRGILEETIFNEERAKTINRYWIYLE